MDVQQNKINKILLWIRKSWKLFSGAIVLLIFLNLFIIKKYVQEKPLILLQTPVMKTYKVTGNGFYKKRNAQKWLYLSGEEVLDTNTQVQTGDQTQAILSFLGAAGKVEISERTEIVLYKNAQETSIDFINGELFINYQASSPKENLIVRIGKRLFRLNNTDLYIFGNAKSQVAISVDYGKATMVLGDHANTFEKGQMIFFKNTRDYSVEESPFQMSTPLNYDHYSLNGETYNVRFAYAPLQKEYLVQLLIGGSIFDMKPYFSKPLVVKNNEFSIALPQGSYYWRLAAYDKANKEPAFYSHTKRFFIEPRIRIQPVMPLADGKVILKNGTAKVQFQWDNPSQLEKTFIEISDEKKFGRILVHESAMGNNFYIYEFKKSGEYYWRVSGFPFGSSDIITGVTRKIQVLESDNSKDLQLVFPQKGTQLTTVSLTGSDVHFQWHGQRDTRDYSVEIESKNKKNKYEYQVQGTSIKITDLPTGAYSWKVLEKENPQVQSEVAEFFVVRTKKLGYKKEDHDGFLEWEKGPVGTNTYRVEALRIGSKTDLNEFFNKNSRSKKQFEIKREQLKYQGLSEGTYAFKIYALDKNKNILADSDLKFVSIK